ncbi:MAG: hypothetical protein WAS93_03620 [Burkholderiaceae bacterium]
MDNKNDQQLENCVQIDIKYLYEPTSRIYMGLTLDVPDEGLAYVDFEPPHPAQMGKVWRMNKACDAWIETGYHAGQEVYPIMDGAPLILTELDQEIPDGYAVEPQPSPAHRWDARKRQWALDQSVQDQMEAQAEQERKLLQLAALEQALQQHINQTVMDLGLGFTDEQSLIGQFSGYDNVFRPIAEAVGQWVAAIRYTFAHSKAAMLAGEKPIPALAEALAEIPPFVMPEVQNF